MKFLLSLFKLQCQQRTLFIRSFGVLPPLVQIISRPCQIFLQPLKLTTQTFDA